MRTNIEIDPVLAEHVMKSGDFRTRKAAVDASLRFLAKIQGQIIALELFGTIPWEGNLEELRLNRFPEWQEREG